MFTGLVQDIGVVKSIETPHGSDVRLEIETSLRLQNIELGASICCSGCCLTVVEKTQYTVFFEVSAETLLRTQIGAWKVMTSVNLEPSLKMGDELGGHFVFGHVDGLSEVLSIAAKDGSRKIVFSIPEGLGHLIAEKGSVALDGVSLTVNGVDERSFWVNIIPHTWEMTTLGNLNVGDKVAFEADMLARYVARMVRECK